MTDVRYEEVESPENTMSLFGSYYEATIPLLHGEMTIPIRIDDLGRDDKDPSDW